MVSRRNVISVCVVIAVMIVLVIMLLVINKPAKNNIYDEQETNNNAYTMQAEVNKTEQASVAAVKYMVKQVNGQVCIYKLVDYNGEEKQEFFDYAFINPEISGDIDDKLQAGIIFYGDKELYDFLQSYSS